MASTLVEASSSSSSHLAVINSTRDQGLGLLDDADVAIILERKTGLKNLPVLSWHLEPHLDKSGFMGSYFRLTVTINKQGRSETFIFFGKTPPPPGPQREFASFGGLFTKEITMYDEIISRMKLGSGAKWSAECYLCKRDVIMVMEDLTLVGYKTLDKYVPFGFEELACLFGAFARLHAGSMLLEERLSIHGKSIYDLWGDQLNEGLFTNTQISMMMTGSSLSGSLALVDMVDGLGGDQKILLKDKISKWTLNLKDAFKPSKKYKNVICHRDVWSANFMFKMDKNKKFVDCRLIDFQFFSYLYPAMDLLLAMYMNSSRAVRDNHFESLLTLYHARLAKLLRDEGLDVDCLLPWEILLESCEEARPTALVYVLNNQQITLLDAGACDKYFNRSTEELNEILYGPSRHRLICPQFSSYSVYRNRLTENIFEILERLPAEIPK